MIRELIFSSPLMVYTVFILGYALLGAGIKYIDDAFDEKTFSIRKSLLLAPVLGILWAYLMSLSPASATILFAIVLAVLLKGKVDNVAHQAGLLSIVVVVMVSGYFQFVWIALAIFTIAGVLDEVGNDFVDEKNFYAKGGVNKFIHLFFEYRFTMKAVIFVFALLGHYGFEYFAPFEWQYFFAFLAFDIGYVIILKISERIKRSGRFSYITKNNNNNGLSGITNGRTRINKDS